jgi:hypothetical protein
MYFQTIKQFTKVLKNLSQILDKGEQLAEAKKFKMEVLLQSRLSPDQFPLLRQVQIACDTAKLAAARLAQSEAPVHEDNEQTREELVKRINSVVQYLSAFNESDFSKAAATKITHARWENKYLMGENFLIEHAIPNFYFHVTTAYSILRHNGVSIGKSDYLGEISFKKD